MSGMVMVTARPTIAGSIAGFTGTAMTTSEIKIWVLVGATVYPAGKVRVTVSALVFRTVVVVKVAVTRVNAPGLSVLCAIARAAAVALTVLLF